ncbi:hypothetical protein A9K55_001963 [Cordyceps militaris]|uniref:Uncharacterized protein n=1 Tax=Cordyceps militaris TaxID=73501 RepID=A0A2H4SR10_CORMI|nr:hypothetical protein A9K55_001963 [Cordyceps militaris]
MGKDSHKKRDQSEAPPSRSQFLPADRHRPGGEGSSVNYSRSSYTPSRLSQVTNSGDISDVDVQAEALSNMSFASERPPAVPLTFDTISAWIKQGGKLETLDDSTLERLLSQYLGPKGDRSGRRKYRAPKVAPPAAPILEDEEVEDDGGVSLHDASSSSSRHKEKGKGRAR